MPTEGRRAGGEVADLPPTTLLLIALAVLAATAAGVICAVVKACL